MMRRPVVHFVCIGAVLFALAASRSYPAPPLTAIGADAADGSDAELLYRAGVALGLDRDDVVVQARLLRNMRFLDRDQSNRNALYRDALRLGVGSSDVVIRRRVIERMASRLRAAAVADEPTETELRAYLDTHYAAFRIPPRVALVQVFFSRQRRGAHLEDDARAGLTLLQGGDVEAMGGDPLPIAVPAGLVSERDIARVLGPKLAAGVLALPVGRWSTPIASRFGLHLVKVTQHVEAADPSFDSVRAQVREAVREARGEAALQEGLAALRAAWSR